MAAPELGTGPAVLAVDVGGTQLKAAVLDGAGRLGGVIRRPTPRSAADPGDAIVVGVAALLAELQRPDQPIGAIGLTIPGVVDEAAGIGHWSANLGWRDFGFRDALAARTGLPVAVAHDVRAAGTAEARLGAAREVTDAAIVVVGTGIAAALRIGGHSYSGNGSAGELGHLVIDPSGPRCACGKHGCVEALAAAPAIVRAYQELGGGLVTGAAEVLARAQDGDQRAAQVWGAATWALGAGLGALSALVAPELIVLGGGLAEAGDALLDPVRAALSNYCAGLNVPRLVRAELGHNAGTWGAAILARDALLTR